MKDYYYLRSGYLHCIHPIDDAIKLTETEDNEVKQKIAATPSEKKQILENLWNHLIGENKNGVFNFTEYLDKKCHEKREYCRKLGI